MLAARVSAGGVAVLLPVTDLTLSADTCETRTDAELYFARSQVAGVVNSYLSGVDPRSAGVAAVLAVRGLARDKRPRRRR